MRIYARKTFIEEIEYGVAQKFVSENHMQKESKHNGKILSFGLFHENNLVGVAQFCYPRTPAKKREYTTELLRLCFKKNIYIVGGASKLIKYYINLHNPTDIFTYQDTTGENTDVYEQCGFILRSIEKKKQYLVKNGLTIHQGHNNSAEREEYYTISQVVNRGPDSLLGTKLGEQFHKKPDGTLSNKRKTNIELFIDLGWHIEETTGDKIYEWFNPNLSFYTYRITASDSDKYYYGVRSIKIPFDELTIKDCLKDDYMGSGGRKFATWRNKHKANLRKNIIEMFPKKFMAYNNEKILVGDSYLTDPLCLNSSEGGVQYEKKFSEGRNKFYLSECQTHGLVKHINEKCVTCAVYKNISYQMCEIHGLTKFRGAFCSKCVSAKNLKIEVCRVHGETKHINKKCLKCANQSSFIEKLCDKHDLVVHHGNVCLKCVKENSITMQICLTHGETKHVGEKCFKCFTSESFSTRFCKIHGETVFRGDNCEKCKNDNLVSVKTCPTHGEVKHIGDKCYKCRKNVFNIQMCDIHGETKHQKGSCLQCTNDKKITIKICSTHGETKHFGNTCGKCNSLKMFYFDTCSVHGETKFKKNECVKCKAQKAFVIKVCEIHGETKFKGKSCCQCVSEKTAHKRWHKEKQKQGCVYCEKIIQSV